MLHTDWHWLAALLFQPANELENCTRAWVGIWKLCAQAPPVHQTHCEGEDSGCRKTHRTPLSSHWFKYKFLHLARGGLELSRRFLSPLQERSLSFLCLSDSFLFSNKKVLGPPGIVIADVKIHSGTVPRSQLECSHFPPDCQLHRS